MGKWFLTGWKLDPESPEYQCLLHNPTETDLVDISWSAVPLIYIFIIIIIIKRGRQCKAEREWYTLYQSEDPSPTIPTFRQEEEKVKNIYVDSSRDREA